MKVDLHDLIYVLMFLTNQITKLFCEVYDGTGNEVEEEVKG